MKAKVEKRKAKAIKQSNEANAKAKQAKEKAKAKEASKKARNDARQASKQAKIDAAANSETQTKAGVEVKEGAPQERTSQLVRGTSSAALDLDRANSGAQGQAVADPLEEAAKLSAAPMLGNLAVKVTAAVVTGVKFGLPVRELAEEASARASAASLAAAQTARDPAAAAKAAEVKAAEEAPQVKSPAELEGAAETAQGAADAPCTGAAGTGVEGTTGPAAEGEKKKEYYQFKKEPADVRPSVGYVACPAEAVTGRRVSTEFPPLGTNLDGAPRGTSLDATDVNLAAQKAKEEEEEEAVAAAAEAAPPPTDLPAGLGALRGGQVVVVRSAATRKHLHVEGQRGTVRAEWDDPSGDWQRFTLVAVAAAAASTGGESGERTGGVFALVGHTGCFLEARAAAAAAETTGGGCSRPTPPLSEDGSAGSDEDGGIAAAAAAAAADKMSPPAAASTKKAPAAAPAPTASLLEVRSDAPASSTGLDGPTTNTTARPWQVFRVEPLPCAMPGNAAAGSAMKVRIKTSDGRFLLCAAPAAAVAAAPTTGGGGSGEVLLRPTDGNDADDAFVWELEAPGGKGPNCRPNRRRSSVAEVRAAVKEKNEAAQALARDQAMNAAWLAVEDAARGVGTGLAVGGATFDAEWCADVAGGSARAFAFLAGETSKVPKVKPIDTVKKVARRVSVAMTTAKTNVKCRLEHRRKSID